MNETFEHQSDQAETAIAQNDDSQKFDANTPFANLNKIFNKLSSDVEQINEGFKIEGELRDLLAKEDLKTVVDKYPSLLGKIASSRDSVVTQRIKMGILEYIGDDLRENKNYQIAKAALRQAQYIADHGEGEIQVIAKRIVDHYSEELE